MVDNVPAMVALSVGTAGAFACFGFTYWLSDQRFHCPAWDLYCNVTPTVRAFASNLGLVQGILSTIYDIFLFMMAYPAYLLGETTLWPAMCVAIYSNPFEPSINQSVRHF